MSATSTVRSTFAPRDVLLLATLACMWGLSFLYIKVAVVVFAPVWVVALRSVIGALVLLVILRVRGSRLPRGWRTWRDLTFVAVSSNAVPWTMMAWATQFLPSGTVSVVNALAPTSTLLIATVVGLESPSVRRFAGLLVALAGTVLAVSPNLGVPGAVLAAVAVASATVCYGIGTVFTKQRVSGTHPPLAIAAGQVLVAAVLTVPAAAVISPLPAASELTVAVVTSLLALGILGTGTAFLVFYVLVARVGATSSIMVTYLIPVVALAAGALVLGEVITPIVLAGAALTIGGVWLAQRERVTSPVEQLEELPR